MRKRMLKKSQVLREGYMKGLRKAQRVIKEMLAQSQGFDGDLNDFDDIHSGSGMMGASAEKNNSGMPSMAQLQKMGPQAVAKKIAEICCDEYQKVHNGGKPSFNVAKKWILRAKVAFKGVNVVNGMNDYPQGTPLYWACSANDEDFATWLLNNGAKVNANECVGGETPLIQAVGSGNLNLVKELISHGADVNVVSYDGVSPLIAAIDWVHSLPMCKILLNAGADVNLQDENSDMSPLDYANEAGPKFYNLLSRYA